MKRLEFPLSEVYRLLEPGPVVLVTTARKGRANIMPLSWHTMMEVVHAWITPSRKHPRTIHHQGEGVFMVAGRTVVLPSKITSRAQE